MLGGCRWTFIAAMLCAGLREAAPAQDTAPRIPLVTGLVLGSVLQSPLGERERPGIVDPSAAAGAAS